MDPNVATSARSPTVSNTSSNGYCSGNATHEQEATGGGGIVKPRMVNRPRVQVQVDSRAMNRFTQRLAVFDCRAGVTGQGRKALPTPTEQTQAKFTE